MCASINISNHCWNVKKFPFICRFARYPIFMIMCGSNLPPYIPPTGDFTFFSVFLWNHVYRTFHTQIFREISSCKQPRDFHCKFFKEGEIPYVDYFMKSRGIAHALRKMRENAIPWLWCVTPQTIGNSGISCNGFFIYFKNTTLFLRENPYVLDCRYRVLSVQETRIMVLSILRSYHRYDGSVGEVVC